MPKKILGRIWNALREEPLTPRLEREHREILIQRSRVASLVAPPIYFFTILVYNLNYYPEALRGGLIAAIPPSIGCVIVFFSLRSRFMQRHYHLPLFLILGIFSNYAEAVNLQSTGGGSGLFFFPFLLIYFATTTWYPGQFLWILSTFLCSVIFYTSSEWIVGRDLSAPHVATNIIVTVQGAVSHPGNFPLDSSVFL